MVNSYSKAMTLPGSFLSLLLLLANSIAGRLLPTR